MSTELMFTIIVCLSVLFIALLILLIPPGILASITRPFSFKTFGIRKLVRLHSRTDTLANLFLWLSVIYCLLFPLVPYSQWIFGLWITLSWLCAVSRAIRLSQVPKNMVKLCVIFMITLIYGYGLVMGLGILNHHELWIRSVELFVYLSDPENWKLFYFLSSPDPASYVLQFCLMLYPLCLLWGQFKYMRLENTYKSRNLFFYIFKSLICVALILGMGIFGLRLIDTAYQTEARRKIESQSQKTSSVFELPDPYMQKI